MLIINWYVKVTGMSMLIHKEKLAILLFICKAAHHGHHIQSHFVKNCLITFIGNYCIISVSS